MPEITSDEVKTLIQGSEDINFVNIEISDNNAEIVGSPSIIRKILFFVGDMVWPAWYENSTGKKTYLKWADDCKDGHCNFVNKGFFSIAEPKLYAYLDLLGVNYNVDYKTTGPTTLRQRYSLK